jgi:lysophospholipase L1-like esterase
MTREAAYGSIAGKAAVVDIASTSASDPGTTARPATSRHARRAVSWAFLAGACACAAVAARASARPAAGLARAASSSLPSAMRARSVLAEEDARAVLGAAYGRCDDAVESCPLDLSLGPFAEGALAAGDPNARAHLFILGDSIDKLMHISACNALVSERERCAFLCSTPVPRQYPRNAAPFMSETESKESPASGTCCAGDAGECCASEFAFRTALACRPRTYANGAGDAGFLMLMGSSQHGPYFEPEEWKTGAQPNPYVAYGLPTSTSERVANAFPAFLAWTKDTRPVTTLVGANIIWELFRWGVEPGFDPDAFRAGLVSQSSNDLLKAFEDQTRALLAQTRETLAVHNRESSQACVFLRTQPVPVSFPEVGVIAGLTDLVSVLNDAVRRVADEAGAPLFDAARGSASMFPGDDRVSQSVAAAAYFEDGYHPTSEHAAALYALLREWAREALPEHCRLSEENGQ